MSIFHDNAIVGASGQATGYNLTRSLRFRQSASAYLSRTPASATNRKTWTYSAWVKRSSISSDDTIFAARTGSGATYLTLVFNSQNDLRMESDSETAYPLYKTNAVFRDPSSWYHIVVALDMTQATSTNRLKVYVNGVLQTAASYNVPAQNTDLAVNSTETHLIGQQASGSYFDGYLTEINFIDGQALTPSSFGETSTTTGVWQPKRYAGTYGTNGFYLPFTDNSALTSGSNAGLGKDFSGNGNYWNTNNISITSGSTYDSMTDVPTLTSATASNFAVMNPLIKPYGTLTPSEANLKVTTSNVFCVVGATNTLPSSGKYYWEFTKISGSFFIGLYKADLNASAIDQQDNSGGTLFYYDNAGEKAINGVRTSYGASYNNNDVIGVAVDMDAQSVTFYKNNSSQGAISFPSNMQGVALLPAAVIYGGVMVANFGQRPFAYTPPTGYVALNTYNLPTPTIGATASSQANKYFDISLYTGTGSTQTITNSGGFSPDFLWAKARSSAFINVLSNRVVGSTSALSSNNTNAEFTVDTTYASNGFTVNSDINANGTTFVGWQWKANGTGVTNTAGSITSTVSANTTSGFSIVTYTGTGSNATVGHGLGVAPKMVIVKVRNDTARDWCVYHASVGNTGSLFLNLTSATATNSVYWNDTSPTSTVFSIGTAGNTNASSKDFVAYCFAEVAGFSKFGSYTANGSTDGPFIYTGFRPKYVMVKLSSSAGEGWWVYDGARNTYNYVGKILAPNSSGSEIDSSGYSMDFVANGFKIRGTNPVVNQSGDTYIYMAFAENPFKYSLAR